MKHIKENNQITYNMNKNLLTAATPTLGVRSYESPTVSVVEVISEGVLCASSVGSNLSVDEWQDGEFSW